ncbi:MAG: hypothetical protein PHN88_07100 [Ignavibacteria bacterium]|nr:hypothetical protein [Ignavibacteria bacterium]
MKKYILSAFLLVVTVLTSGLNAQQDSSSRRIINSDTVIIGKYYYMRTIDGSEIVGKLIGVNAGVVKISVEDEMVDIQQSEVKSIRNNVYKEWSVDKPLFNMNKPNDIYFSVGIAYPMDDGHQYSSYYSKSLTISAGTMFATSKYVGFRGDAVFSRLSKDDYNSPDNIGTGGSVNSLSARVNFLVGDFIPKDINYYFIFGAGMGMYYRTERKLYYGNPLKYLYTEQATTRPLLSGTLGLNVNINFVPKLRIFIEPSINYVISSDFPNYYALKAGVIL